MKRSICVMTVCLLATIAMMSCERKASTTTDKKETEKQVENTVPQPSLFPDYERTPTGLYYKKIVEGTDQQLQMGDIVILQLAYYVGDSLLFSTEDMPEPAIDQVRESFFKGDFYEGLRMMHVGDSMSFMINSDSTYRKHFHVPILPSFVKPDVFMRWEVIVEKTITMEEYNQMIQERKDALAQNAKDELAAYLKKNHVKAQAQEGGLIYVCTKKGKGPKPGYKQKVKVHYTGKLLDGTVFDSSIDRGEPFEFELGVGRVIRGWDEGIALMSKGEKGVLYIPYDMAYGENGTGPIPPYANLIFEVELVDFE